MLERKKKSKVERENILCLNVGYAEMSLKYFSETSLF